MRLTTAQRRILTLLRDEEDKMLSAPEERYENPADEIVCSGRECWIGLERTSWPLVLRLLRILAVSDRSDHGFGDNVQRFRINATGRCFLKDESQIDNVISFLRRNEPFTIKNGEVVKMAG